MSQGKQIAGLSITDPKAIDSQSFEFTGPATVEDEDELIRERDGAVIVERLDENFVYTYPDGSTSTLPNPYLFGWLAKFIVIVPDFSASYEVQTTLGHVGKEQAGASYHFEQLIAFGYETQATLKYIPEGEIKTHWVGKQNNPPAVTISGKVITLSRPFLGSLVVSCNTKCDIWGLQVLRSEAQDFFESDLDGWLDANGPMESVLVAIQGDKKDIISTNWTDKNKYASDPALDEDGNPIFWKIFYQNNCEKTPVPGVHGILNGIEKTADSEGLIDLGELPSGTKINHKAYLTGVIISTELDNLANDLIEIP